jgi:hypothetical protein
MKTRLVKGEAINPENGVSINKNGGLEFRARHKTTLRQDNLRLNLLSVAWQS